MKKQIINHVHEEARIYKRNYKPSLNIFRQIISIFCVLISGQSQTAHSYQKKK